MSRLGVFIDRYTDIPEEWYRELLDIEESECIENALATTARVIVIDSELIKSIQNPALREYLSKLYELFKAPFIITVI